MKVLFLSFIGIAINIWKDTAGGGGAPEPLVLLDRFGAEIETRTGDTISTRV